MNRELLIRIYTLFLAVAIVFPMAVGFTHALHDHDSQMCMAKNESHIHSQGIDCHHEHYFSPGGNIQFFATDDSLQFDDFVAQRFGATCEKSQTLKTAIGLRAPPMIFV